MTSDSVSWVERSRSTWSRGDFGQIARYGRDAAAQIMARLPISAGATVLDIACGTGNMSIPAARRGARVTGIDLVPQHIDEARRWAAAEELRIRFDEGNAEQLPYQDGAFDVVMGVTGVMFSPHPSRVVEEMTRVCRPGGLIVMANYTQEGFIGEMVAIGSRYLPSTGELASPLLWGDEGTVRERFGGWVADLGLQRKTFTLEYPFPPQEVMDLYRCCFGPTIMVLSRLGEEDQARYARDLTELWRKHNRSEGSRTAVSIEYLEVIATRA